METVQNTEFGKMYLSDAIIWDYKENFHKGHIYAFASVMVIL